jgi:Protein of unknown function (DUF2971)
VRQHHPKDMPRFRAEVTAQNWGKTVREIEEYLAKLGKHTFMLSTSAPIAGFHPRDNLYMWGHYGNGHRGIAIEFDTEKVAAEVLKYHEEPQRVADGCWACPGVWKAGSSHRPA